MIRASELGQILHDEHRQTLDIMNALEDQLLNSTDRRPLDTRREDVRRLLRDVTAVADRDANHHFRFEEEVLFPIFEAAGAGDMTRMLKHEHEAIRAFGSRVRHLAEVALGDGFDTAAWTDFRAAAMDLVQSTTFHIQKEEMGLVGRLGFFVDADTDRQLTQRYLGSVG